MFKDNSEMLFQIFFSSPFPPPEPTFYAEDDDETIYTDDDDNPFTHP